jgi:hypothetical protein
MSSVAAAGLHVEALRGPNLEVMNVHASTGAPAERVLRDMGMPPEGIRMVLVADDPRLVRRHLELHRERLMEELIDRRLTLAALERELADAAIERAGPDGRSAG